MLETYMQHLSIGISIFMLGAITGAVFSYLRYKDWIKHLEYYEQWYHDHGLRLKKKEAVYTASNKARQRVHSEICPVCKEPIVRCAATCYVKCGCGVKER